MGIFDRLFGGSKRNNKQETKERAYRELENNDDEYIFDSARGGLIKKGDIEREEKIKTGIRERALSAARQTGAEKYVLDEQQTESHAETLEIEEFFPVNEKRFVVFDLETTGLKYSDGEIVEIGAVRVENGEITEEYSQLVYPSGGISAEASAVNHITMDMLEGQPEICEVLPSFLKFVGKDVLVAHNVRFDYQFLANSCMQYFFKVPDTLFDTMLLAKYYPETKNKKLTALVQAAGIELETAHRALSDARMTAKLILKTNEKVLAKGIRKQEEKELDYSRCTEDVEVIDDALKGLRFCITGGIPGYERADVERIIKQHNGRMTQSISGKTDYLILGTYDLYEEGYISAKHRKALELINSGEKIQIIDAEMFFKLINGKSTEGE